MNNSQEDEFVAVRVQDPRVQNEGSWNSYVDYKIFLHTNSRAFTAKTSCVRRRYSEFAWLKKKLQKNAGLVPVPDLPGKSFLSFSNKDFLERRRKGLQGFLDQVVHMTVCLSDSQLHLFLQTQLPIGHIQDCVQGHTPYTVTDAILTYASSNRGFAQAQEEDSIKEPSLTVSYESMESPAPHQPCLQAKDTFSPELVPCGDTDPLEGLLQLCEKDSVELQHTEKPSVRVLQRNNHLEAVVEDCDPTEASFFLGDSPDEPESPHLLQQSQQRSCQIQTPVEVHSPMGAGFEVDSVLEEVCSVREGSFTTLDTQEEAVTHPGTEEKADRQESSEEANVENNLEEEKCLNAVKISDFKDTDTQYQEDILEEVCSETHVLENHLIPEVNGLDLSGATEGHVADVSCLQEFRNSVEQEELENKERVQSESKEEMPLESEILEATNNVLSFPQVQSSDDGIIHQTDQRQVEQKVDLVGNKDERDADNHSLPSSNESIVKVSDEESICDESEDSTQAENGYMKTHPEDISLWSEVEASSRNILDLHMNGCAVEKEDISTQESEEEDLQDVTEISEMSKTLDQNTTLTGGDLTENSDFSILETSCSSELADSKCAE